MKKLLLKLFLPKPDKITTQIVDVVAKFVNTSDKSDVIAKYGALADDYTKIQAKITAWLRDGKISYEEQQELYKALLPLVETAVNKIKEA
ncbi:hypothetical protein [Fibrobacter sp.]|uniref:hypothetical protein n=1 Tax=Fibrobacter sp. TaxID=35828 RepID=UPI0038905A21